MTVTSWSIPRRGWWVRRPMRPRIITACTLASVAGVTVIHVSVLSAADAVFAWPRPARVARPLLRLTLPPDTCWSRDLEGSPSWRWSVVKRSTSNECCPSVSVVHAGCRDAGWSKVSSLNVTGIDMDAEHSVRPIASWISSLMTRRSSSMSFVYNHPADTDDSTEITVQTTALLGTLYIRTPPWLHCYNCAFTQRGWPHTMPGARGGRFQINVSGFRWKRHLLHWEVRLDTIMHT